MRVALVWLSMLCVVPTTLAELGGDFTLTDHNGQRYSLAQDRDKIVLLSFGYTNCPDVCPLTLAVVAAALHQLGPRAEQVRALFISRSIPSGIRPLA